MILCYQMFLKLIVLSPISKKKLKQVQKRFQKGCKISFEYADGGQHPAICM